MYVAMCVGMLALAGALSLSAPHDQADQGFAQSSVWPTKTASTGPLHDHANPVGKKLHGRLVSHSAPSLHPPQRQHHPLTRSTTHTEPTEPPPQSIWEDQFKRMLERGSMEPCGAGMRASGLTRAKTGLGSRINTFAYEVWHAMMYNMSFSICSNGRQIGWWSQYFQDSHMYSVCNSSSKPGVCDPFMKTVGGAVNELRKRNLSADYVDDMWRFIYRKVFTLKMSERDARRRVLESAGLVLDKPFIALHMRRGDKYKEAVIVQSSVYANATKQFLGPSQRNSRFGALLNVLRYEMAAKQASQVFVSSDDEEAAQEMQRSLGQSAKVICQPRLGNENYYAKRDYDNSTTFPSRI